MKIKQREPEIYVKVCVTVLITAKMLICPSHRGHWVNSLSCVLFSVSFAILCHAVCLFVCGISLTSGQLVIELFPDCTRSCFSQVVLRRRGGDRIYEMRCLFVAVGPNARFIVLPHWDNMSQAHMLTHPVTLY